MAIIYLYENTATDFRYNGQPLPKAYEVVVEYTINDSYFVTFKHPLDDAAVYKQIKKDMIVTVHTPDGLQPMRIMDETKHMDSVEYEAWPLLYADMRTKLVKPLALRGQTGTSAINYFVQNLLIDTPFDFSSNISETHDYHTQNTEDNENNPHALFNALDVLKDIVNRWNGELQINGYDIRMVNRLGKNTDALLYEKKNISEFTDEESIQGVVTRLYGISEWEEESDVEGEEPIKHTINTMVESPLIGAYSGIVFEKQYTNNDMRTEEQLKSWLNLKFTTENIDKPTRSITVGTNIIDGEEIHAGDTLVLKYIKHDADMSIRMVGYKYDGYADRYISVDLGDAKDTYTGNMQNIIDDNRNNLSNQMKQQYASIVNSLGEKMIYSVDEPSGNFKEGDVWFDQQGGMYFWDEESQMWIDHPYNKNKHVVEEQISGLQGEVEEAKKSAGEAEQLANDALTKAGESDDIAKSAKDAADRAETNATAAGNKAADALAQSSSAVTAAEEAIQSIATFEPLVAGAVTKADDAIAKANNIPITIDNTITAKGLVSGDWVNTRIDDATGEINYAITSVKGEVPNVVMGAEWSKKSSPELSRTDYVEEFANLRDYGLKTAEYDLSIDGLTSNLQAIEVSKLDSSEFTSFKSNEYSQTVNGITNRLSSVETNKLESSTFTNFKEHDYDVTVSGINGNIESLEAEKLDSVEFSDFKSNEYELTVNGFKMDLMSVSGAIPTLILGVEWSRSEDPAMTRTDYTEDADLTDYHNPDYIMGATWDKSSDPTLARSDGVQELVELQDYKTQTADFKLTLDGFEQNLTDFESRKLDASLFTTFKTNEYTNTIDGITNRLTKTETNKLDGSDFLSFKTNDYQVTVDGLAGRLMSVESNKLDNSTFQTFKTSDYSVAVDGLDGKIQSLETKKLDSADFASFKTNDYQLTVNGFDMALTSVSGAIPTIILGVSWSKASNPTMERTNDAAAIDLSNYDSPDYIMGVEWLRDSKPEMDRIRDTQESTSTKDFEIFLGDYNFNAQGWNATNAYINDNKTSINSLISNAQGWSNTISYVDENKTAINETISQVTHYKQTIIGENGEKIAQLVMTDDAFVTRVSDLENMTADIVLGVEWERASSPRMVRTGFMEDWASSQISQLADNINLKVSEGDVISQINIEAKRTLIQSDKLYLDANSVVFSNKAFIPSAAIVELTADKITSGKLDANKVRVVNLDANEITANQTQFITTYWNSAVGGGVSIDGNGILSTAANKSQTYIQNGIVGTRNPSGATIGQIGYINTGTIATYSLRTSWGSHFELRQRANADTEYTMIRAENGATNFFINAKNNIYLTADHTYDRYGNVTSYGRVNIDAQLRITSDDEFRMTGGNIINPYGIYFDNGGSIYTLTPNDDDQRVTRFNVNSTDIMQFRVGTAQKFRIDSTRNYMNQTLNMNGNSITESPSVSDGRLKDISGDRVDNDLQKLLSIKYVNFMWKEDGKPDFGFIAQQIQGFAPEIARDVNGGWLGYDQASYTHLIGHALQQHAGITANQLTQLRQENEALHDRITGLEVRITELEGAM